MSIEYQIRGAFGEHPRYYFYGFDNYSEAVIWQNTGDYPHWVKKNFWTLQIGQRNSNNFITFGGGYPENNFSGDQPYYEYRLRNNTIDEFNIVYYNRGNKYIDRETYDIEYENNRLIISTRDVSDGTMPPRFYIFHNTSREELLRIYLTNFLKSIDYIINREWIVRNRDVSARDVGDGSNVLEKEYSMEDVNNILRILTKYELSIFRNYMYARHNYSFRTNSWNIFFSQYYRQNYNGTRTNEEVMLIMTDYERSILEMVIENENRR
jgi:hypothetical protein